MDRLYEKLVSYAAKDFYPMHMPGHKRNVEMMGMLNPYMLDITEIEGFDNLHQAEGVLKELSERIRRLYRSKRAFPLVNGSTAGILAAISAATGRGDKVLVARNAHKSVYNALMLRELEPVYYYPHLIEESSIFCGILASEIEEMLINNPGIKAVIITSPSYEGVVSDIRKIADTVHRHNAILIVDEAHGAHFGFIDELPQTSVKLGADLVIQSIHKTLPAFTQTAILHSNRDDLNTRIEKYLACYQSSSPSYILMAGIDRCISLLEEHGKKLFEDYYNRLSWFYDSVSDLERISLLNSNIIGKQGVFDWDPSKLTVFVRNTDINGHQLQDILRNHYHIEMEMAAVEYALGIASICDTYEGFLRMSAALHDIDKSLHTVKHLDKENEQILRNVIKPERFMLPYQAAECRTELVNLSDSVGRISATSISLFPPGCPLIVPGEKLDTDLIDYIRRVKDTGICITGLTGEDKESIEVVIK